ncbi:hypothetical protein IDH44_20875 [Paenibacillus sp. IB182496]|uniref:Uncharacterized protein n=1 Tax=Paenibacillus sabuli TaxID=2772509 RepID=A0A927GUF6_9BACL|nr:hypothetical protein [Paenibacillus sabuli]MBD2847652.1 hypothetical protein [Paenibacillus sabuli]
MSNETVRDYTALLERWAGTVRNELYEPQDRPELACYGSGENGWGVQTNQKAFAAIAALAASPELDEQRCALSRAELKTLALRMLRYSLQSHIDGDYHCADGQSWGHTWISVLGIERMMHGVDALEEELTEEDRVLLRRVLLSECDWLLDHYEIGGGLYARDGHNKPESNLWNGAVLLRAAQRYPDGARVSAYRDKALTFLINSISVPSDERDHTLTDGQTTVAARFVGANFFESMALNHHGYLNVGYMVICLSNMAMLHFDYRRRGQRAPDALYHHGRELWELVKLCTFADGRLLRIGGDTRARYTYCQDYVVPVWHMARDLWADPDCAAFEAGWLALVRAEQEAGEDGSFLAARCGALRRQSPLYYARLESDRAVALSMGLAWHGLIGGEPFDEAEPPAPVTVRDTTGGDPAVQGQGWQDEAHGAYLHVGPRRIASWVWDAAEKPQGLCLPPGRSDMAEWKHNLSVRIDGVGRITEQTLEGHGGYRFDGGFATWGSTLHRTQGQLAEGQQDHDIARSRIVCAALPDGATMVVLQQAVALERRVYVNAIRGLHLLMPNDLFNGGTRTYYTEDEAKHGMRRLYLPGAGASKTSQAAPHGAVPPGRVEETVHTGSRWLNVDDELGVAAAYGASELSIHRPASRQIGLRAKPNNVGLEGMLYADELCGPFSLEQQAFEADAIMIDAGYVLRAGADRMATAALAADADSLSPSADGLRGVRVCGADGRTYAVLANFGAAPVVHRLRGERGRDLADGASTATGGQGVLEIAVSPGTARVIEVEA